MKRVCKKCSYIDVNEKTTCPVCANNEWENYEIYQIKQISTDESFVEAMIKLKEENIIEYQLKMSQFKTQVQQQKQLEQGQNSSDTNIPKCPTCSSTNLKKITSTSKVVNTAIWGIFGTKRHKTYHCNNCGYEW